MSECEAPDCSNEVEDWGIFCNDCYARLAVQRPVTTDLADRKQYLGDGVYGAVENGMLRLTTENGISAQNVVYLEPEVAWAILRWLASEGFRL